MTFRRLAAAIVVVALAGTLAACTGKDAVGGSSDGFRFVSGTQVGQTYPIGERKPAGNITVDLLDGKGTYSLGQDRGKVVVINYWASWCGPCTVESPQFDIVYRQYKSKGVTFVGVDTKDARSAGQNFVADNDISYLSVYDEQGETAVQLGKIPALSLPFTVIVDKQGKVAGVYLKPMAPKDIEPLLDQLTTEA